MHAPFMISPKASALDIMDALIEHADLLAANTSLLSSDAFEGFDDLSDETKRTILFGLWRQAETLLALARELSHPKYGMRTLPLTKAAKVTAP